VKILIIAGHGGKPYDPGASGCGCKEAVLTRELAKLVQTELRKYETVEAVLFDQSIDAYKHIKRGGVLPLDRVNYVLEIHFNACVDDERGDGRTTGTEILVKSNEQSINVEQAIVSNLAALGLKNRGVKRNDGLLVMNTVKRAGVSHALLEVCFIDDRDDMQIYLANKKPAAAAVASGIASGFGLKKEENDVFTYEQFKAFMDRYEKEREGLPTSDYARKAWKALADAGITDGSKPRAPLSREDYAVMEQRKGTIGK